jgi:beta-glucosidase
MSRLDLAKRAFPEGFLWGAATAGHQIEGNNVNADYWFLENLQPTMFVERSGDACDSYHRYEEDIALLARLGLNTYRFSIEWSRIEPNRDHFSHAELDHYKRVIACCHTHGVAPVVTFVHSTMPLWFAEAGGWLNSEAPTLFARYCATAARALGDGLALALTLNEPQVGKVFRCIPGAEGYFGSQDPLSFEVHANAATMTNCDRFITMEHPDIAGMTPQLVAGHEQGYAAIKAERSDLQVGVTLSVTDLQAGGEGSPFEKVRADAYQRFSTRSVGPATSLACRPTVWSGSRGLAGRFLRCPRFRSPSRETATPTCSVPRRCATRWSTSTLRPKSQCS